ncbi:MAG: hypothetical protein IT256_08280 [Chitinophagaceae bacterium]|nr:hypothetical protein [Chitinophagaceae bacterium]
MNFRMILKTKIKRVNCSITILMAFLLVFSACGGEKMKPFVSFYYWKQNYKLDSLEKQTLQTNNLQQLYVRYFDVVYDAQQQLAKPVAPVQLAKEDIVNPIVPVVFIKNEVFEKLDSAAVYKLATQTLSLLDQINTTAGIKCRAVQFDCDWTAKTAPKYFYYLKQMREKLDEHDKGCTFASLTMLTATIRLHQVKYPEREGVPPVDKGVLMFYNMGKINTSEVNSIYDQKTSQAYLSSLASYTLRMDVAVPVFAWGIQIRDGQVLTLLNKMDDRDFQNKEEFEVLKPQRYRAVASFFKNGFYFKVGDEVKVEQVDEAAFTQMIADLKVYYPNQFQQVIFYDLDASNISRYEKDFFQKTVTAF